MKRLGIITIIAIMVFNIIGNNVMAKDSNVEVSQNGQNVAYKFEYNYVNEAEYSQKSSPVTFKPSNESWFLTNTYTDIEIYNPSVKAQYKMEAAPLAYNGTNPWETPKYETPKSEAISTTNYWYNPWETPNYEAPKPEAIPTNNYWYNPWEMPKYETPKPEVTPTTNYWYNPWEMPNYGTPKPEVTPVPNYGYNPWEMPKYEVPQPVATPMPNYGYNPWEMPKYETPKPEVTPIPNYGYNPWEMPKYEMPKSEVTPIPYYGYNPWITPYTSMVPYMGFNPWAFYYYYDPFLVNIHKNENTVIDPQWNTVKDEGALKYLFNEVSFDLKLSQVNYELEKARQKLSLLRSNTKTKIDAAIKQKRYMVCSIVGDESKSPQTKDLEIKKIKKELENEIKSIKEDTARQAQLIIEQQNSTIKNIFK